MKRDDVDKFFAHPNKTLMDAKPIPFELNGLRAPKYSLDILLNGHASGVYLTTAMHNHIPGCYTVTIENPNPIWMVIWGPTTVWAGYNIGTGGTLQFGEIQGSRYLCWQDNRLKFPEKGGKFCPSIARPLDPALTMYNDVVAWLGKQTKIKMPVNPIHIPRGLK